MRTVWKYKLQATHIQELRLPEKAEILYVREQNEFVCLWAVVETHRELEARVIEVVPTGVEMETDMGVDRKYLGSVHLQNGALVFHVFERSSS